MDKQVYFYPNGSTEGFPVSSRKDILDILRGKQPAISHIDIHLNDGVYYVLATLLNDVSWFGVGITTGDI